MRASSVTHLISHFEQLQTFPTTAPLLAAPVTQNGMSTTGQNGIPLAAQNGNYSGSRSNSAHKIDASIPSWLGPKEANLVNLDTLTNEKGPLLILT